jgi:hypothetical protein
MNTANIMEPQTTRNTRKNDFIKKHSVSSVLFVLKAVLEMNV